MISSFTKRRELGVANVEAAIAGFLNSSAAEISDQIILCCVGYVSYASWGI